MNSIVPSNEQPEKPRKGRHHTEESKAKLRAAHLGKVIPESQRKQISETLKGNVPWNKGKPMSEEQKAKLRAHRPSPEAIAKMRATKTGQTLSDEHKHKIGESLKGRPVSEETRRKISEAQIGKKKNPESVAKTAASLRGKSSHMKGKTHNEETRAKIREARKKQVINKGYKHGSEFRAKATANNIRRWQNKSEDEKLAHLDKLHEGARDITNSWIEEYYAQQLDVQGVVYERQKRIGWYRVDFYISDENRIVEINGCYWHGCLQCGQDEGWHQEKRKKDAKRHEYLLKKEYIVEVVWEHDLPRKPYN